MTHKCTPDCTAGWSPGNKCHCRSCGENFTTVANFDRHRAGGVCTHPSLLVGKRGPRKGRALMELNSRGYWKEFGEIDRAEIFTRSVLNRQPGKAHSGE